MPKYLERKTDFLLELIEIDPNLMFLAVVLGRKDFGVLLKTFAGITIKFPEEKKLKEITRRASQYKYSLKKIAKEQGTNLTIKQLADIGLTLDNKDVRKATKFVLTTLVLQQYIKSLCEDDSYSLTIEEITNLDKDDKLELYKLHLQELSKRTNQFKYMREIMKKI
jgi:hypothetical protein